MLKKRKPDFLLSIELLRVQRVPHMARRVQHPPLVKDFRESNKCWCRWDQLLQLRQEEAVLARWGFALCLNWLGFTK